MKRKKIIDKYIQPIFIPKELVVCKNITIEELNKIYSYSGGKDLEPFDQYDAVTYRAIDISTKKKVLLVVLNMEFMSKSKLLEKIDICSHEALHATSSILQECGIQLTDETEETYAYMQGWITKCIYETMIK